MATVWTPVAAERHKATWKKVILGCLFFTLPILVHAEDVYLYVSSDTYDGFYNEMHHKLGSNMPEVRGHIVLPDEQNVKAPVRWINVILFGDFDVSTKATLFFRGDNLYLLGFKNRYGEVYHVGGYQAIFPEGSNELPFTESYTDLVGRSAQLVNVPLGMEAARLSTMTIANYQPGVTTLEDIKRSLATFCIMISEALRFHPIRDTFSDQLGGVTHLTEQHTEYILNWGPMSRALYLWDKDGEWEGKVMKKMKSLDVFTVEHLDRIVDIMLWPNDLEDQFDP